LKSLKPVTAVLKPDQQKPQNNQQPSHQKEEHKIIYNKKAESEFFVDNSALAGFSGERILYMAVRELIEDALSCIAKITEPAYLQTSCLLLFVLF
jgi:hypothetical protein